MKRLTFILFLLFLAQPILACDCEELPFEQEWERVENVLEIKITKVIKDASIGERILEAQVLEVYKGEIKGSTIELNNFVDGGAGCGYYFELGETYLFYGEKGKKDNYYHTTICNRTGELINRKEDIIAINSIK